MSAPDEFRIPSLLETILLEHIPEYDTDCAAHSGCSCGHNDHRPDGISAVEGHRYDLIGREDDGEWTRRNKVWARHVAELLEVERG